MLSSVYGGMVMLEKMTIRNFRSFAGKVTADFAKTNYSLLPQNCSEDGILKGVMFVGANASGKSNVLMAVRILLEMLFMERDVNSSLYKCLFNPDPEFALDYFFRIEGKEIEYEFIVNTQKHSITENLFLEKKQILQRMGSSARVYITDTDGKLFEGDEVDSEILFLRTLYFNTRFAFSPVLRKWMDFLSGSVYINAFEKQIISYGRQNLSIIQYIKDQGPDAVNAFFDEYNFRQTIEYGHKSSGRNTIITVGESESEKDIFFKRKGIEEPIPFAYESTGNQNLIRFLPAFLTVADRGGILLIDEFSSGFHNELERLLIRYFMEKAVGSQMLFVTHSTNLLTNTLLRPDQEYTVEFEGKEGSSIRRVSSRQPRAAQNIEKMYLSGVFGGLPGYRKDIDEN